MVTQASKEALATKRRRSGIKIVHMGLYWLTYKRTGRLAGVAIVSADTLMAARMPAAVDGIGRRAMFE
jgi:hypothetical protein